MTRICSKCKAVLGEKCGNCQSDNLTCCEKGFFCNSCGRSWKQGEQPATHTYCDTCFAEAEHG